MWRLIPTSRRGHKMTASTAETTAWKLARCTKYLWELATKTPITA